MGLAAAALVARSTGAAASLPLWLGAFIASGLPDLDVVLGLFGLRGPRFHRNLSHAPFVVAVVIAAGWLAVWTLPLPLDRRVFACWAAALATHPVLDLLTSGPDAGSRGYGIPLLWPLARRRWYLTRPILETADFGNARSLGDLWRGVRPEVTRLVLPSLGVLILCMIL